MSEVTWSHIRDFVQARDPGYFGSVEGVPREEIRLCEEAFSITLPTFYVEFLAAMGVDCGEFSPFGRGHSSNFYELVEDMPAEYYPGDHYFKVSRDDTPGAVTHADNFIDLRRSDGNDAPLVSFDDCSSFSEEVVVQSGYTLREHLAKEIFKFVEIDRYRAKDVLSIFPETNEAMERDVQALYGLLAKAGLQSVWPPLPRVGCFRKEGTSVLVEASSMGQEVVIRLGAIDRRTAKSMVEQIKDALPEAIADDE